MNEKLGIKPVTDGQVAKWEAERRAADELRTRDIATITAAQTAAAIMAELSEQGSGHQGRDFAPITRQALIAAFIVFEELVGPHLPKTQAEMARAIADKATEHGISPEDQPLDPRSQSVRRIANLALAAADVVNRRDTAV